MEGGERDMPGREGGNPSEGVSSLLPGPPPPTFPRLSTGGEGRRTGSPFRLGFEKFLCTVQNRDIPVTSITPSSVCFGGLPSGQGAARPCQRGSRLQSAEAAPLPRGSGRSPCGFHTIIGDCAMTHCTACRAARPQSARLLSLFDSLGPIMSGPSSSHTAGMARIGRMGRSLVGGTPERITLHFFGALSPRL